MTPSPSEKSKNRIAKAPPLKFAWVGQLAQLATLTFSAVVAVQWLPIFFKHYGINWRAVAAAVGVPMLSGAYKLARSQMTKIQLANETNQLKNAERIALIEDRLDGTILQLEKTEALSKVDESILDRIGQLQVQLEAHEKQYGHPLLSKDFRELQRLVEEIRAVAYRFDRLIALAAQVEEIQNRLKDKNLKNKDIEAK